MALGDRTNPSDFLLGDEDAEPRVPSRPVSAGYSSSDEFCDKLRLLPPETSAVVLESTSPAYSTSDAYLEQLGLAGGGALPERGELAPTGEESCGFSPSDEFLELLEAAPPERRAAARVQRVMPAGMLEPQATPIVVIDLSLTGLRIGCVEPLERNQVLRLELPLRPEPLRLAGRVCWCRQHVSGNYEVGLRLVPLTGAELAAYQAFLAT